MNSIPGWLAFIENGRLSIRDLRGTAAAEVKGDYRQIVGWSPHQTYLLAIQKNGASTVIDNTGIVLKVFDQLPQPAFWAGSSANKEERSEDWLALPRQDGALELMSFPSPRAKLLFEPGSLGADGLAFVRWSSNGEVILTPSLAQLQSKVSFALGFFAPLLENGPDTQNLAAGGGGGPILWDFHKEYFQVLDGVPGSPLSIILGFVIQEQCSSCWADGLELVSLDPWSGKILPLGAVLLNTPETYAWNPAQPGLLALAEGGSRFTLENKRLALLDVPAGTSPRYLTDPDQVVFEPSWSPDGRRLAYTTMPTQAQASGSGSDLEARLGGRKIAVYDLKAGASQTLTHPAQDEIDGWPRWSTDGQTLLYARKQLASSTTQVRQVEIVSGKDELLLTLNDAPPACHRSGCGWEQMVAYSPGIRATVPAPAPVLAPTPAAVVNKDTPRQGMTTYHNPAYGFSIQYPDTWEYTRPYKQLNNYFQLNGPKGVLRIDYRRATQQERIQRTGTGAGEFVRAGSIQFMGKTLQRDLLVYGGKVKEVFYQGDCEFSVGDLVFTLGLDYKGASSYEDADIPQDAQIEADQILESFTLDGSKP